MALSKNLQAIVDKHVEMATEVFSKRIKEELERRTTNMIKPYGYSVSSMGRPIEDSIPQEDLKGSAYYSAINANSCEMLFMTRQGSFSSKQAREAIKENEELKKKIESLRDELEGVKSLLSDSQRDKIAMANAIQRKLRQYRLPGLKQEIIQEPSVYLGHLEVQMMHEAKKRYEDITRVPVEWRMYAKEACNTLKAYYHCDDAQITLTNIVSKAKEKGANEFKEGLKQSLETKNPDDF